VAVKAVMETVRDEEVAGMLNAVTVGRVVSDAAGLLAASPGKVRALISAILLNPSPSESKASMAAKL
jgi:hypothetical protein